MENKKRSLFKQFPALKLVAFMRHHWFFCPRCFGLCRARITECWNGLGWVGRDLKGLLVPSPCHGSCHPCRLQVQTHPETAPPETHLGCSGEDCGRCLDFALLLTCLFWNSIPNEEWLFPPQAVLAGISLEGWRCTLHIREMFAQLSSV